MEGNALRKIGIILLIVFPSTMSTKSVQSTSSDLLGGIKASYGQEKSLFNKILEVNKECKDLTEGDVKVRDDHSIQRRVAITDSSKYWPGGVVRYKIGPEFSTNSRNKIKSSLAEIAEKTCVRFVDLNDDDDDTELTSAYISVRSLDGCWSFVGAFSSGIQQLSLAPGCRSTSIIQHEFMHALGFHHEQNRSDRDQYVIIHWDNIPSNVRHNFNKRSSSNHRDIGTYDYKSIMHYHRTAFSKNVGQPTITEIGESVEMGESSSIQQSDVDAINELYQCNTPTPSPVDDDWGPWTSFGTCDMVCGNGDQQLKRVCQGQNCPGLNTKTIDCKIRDCTEDDWNEYEVDGICSEICGPGEQKYSRDCKGEGCLGDSIEFRDCQNRECTEDDWGLWEEAGECSEPICGVGEQRFERTCTGSLCLEGVSEKVEPCKIRDCSEHEWGPWELSDGCSKPCETGQQKYVRICLGTACVVEIGGYGPEKFVDCNTQPCTVGCSFESDFCGWTTPQSASLQRGYWQRRKGATPSSITGPSGDYPFGTGHYVYADPSGLRRNAKITMTSPKIPHVPGSSKRRCLKFRYYLHGNRIGRLFVRLNCYYSSYNIKRRTWRVARRTSQRGNQWKEWKIRFYIKQNCKIAFEYRPSKNDQSNPALDNISITDTHC